MFLQDDIDDDIDDDNNDDDLAITMCCIGVFAYNK